VHYPLPCIPVKPSYLLGIWLPSKMKIEKPLIFYSDRGIQYACKEFRMLLQKSTLIIQSMSRKGNCWDNTEAESFFLMKCL